LVKPINVKNTIIKEKYMRKDPLEIIEEIFRRLDADRGKAFSINELAKETGFHNLTVRRYIRIIEVIREEQPQIEVIKTKHSIIIRSRRKE
jgi:response regulator of citrate/malate metabolism